VPHFSNLI